MTEADDPVKRADDKFEVQKTARAVRKLRRTTEVIVADVRRAIVDAAKKKEPNGAK